MNEIFKIVLSLSLSGSLLIVILLLCKPFLKNPIGRRWQYYIWLVVIARLLLPFAPEVSPVGTLFQEIDQAITQADHASDPEQSTTLESRQGAGIEIDGGAVTQGEKTSAQKTRPAILHNLWLLWLVLALVLLMRKITIYQGFVRYIKAGCTEVSDTMLLDRLAQIGEQSGVKRPVELYTNSLISSPLLIGFFRPCIVLPTANLPDSDFRYTIQHELTHYKGRDMFYKWLVQFTVCLHWFNPLVYILEHEVGRACELACDETVIRKLDKKNQRAYGDTLVNAIGAGGSYNNAIASVTLNESKELLKERLEAIMKYKKKSRPVILITLVLTLLFVAGAAAIGAYANSKNVEGFPAEARNISVTAKRVADGPDSAEVNGPYMTVEACNIQYESTPYKWPVVVIKTTNNSERTIAGCEIGLLAYDKDGKPLKLYWDARNVARNGEEGSVGFGLDGTDYGIVTGIKPDSSKSYQWTTEGCYDSIAPGGTAEAGGLYLFDGWWDQPKHIHQVKALLSCVKQITFEDGDVWENPAYEGWLSTYRGMEVASDALKFYYTAPDKTT